jgi:hypothetical protein
MQFSGEGADSRLERGRLENDREGRVADLKSKIDRGEYQVDVLAVADALLRRITGGTASAQSTCSKPASSSEASVNVTPGEPSTTRPIQVSSAPIARLRSIVLIGSRASGAAQTQSS